MNNQNPDKTSQQQNLVGSMFQDIGSHLTHSQNFVKGKASMVFGVSETALPASNVFKMNQINFESTKHATNLNQDLIMQNEQNPQLNISSMRHFNPSMKKVEPFLRRDDQYFKNRMPTLKKRPLEEMSDFSRNFQPKVTTHEEFVSQLITNPINSLPDFGPNSRQNEATNAQVFDGSAPLRDKKKELKKNHSQPNQSNLKPSSPIQQEKLRLFSLYQQRGAQRQSQNTLDNSLSKLLNTYSRRSETEVFHQTLKDKQIQKHKISKAKYLFTRKGEESYEIENGQFQFVPGLVKQTRYHQMSSSEAPMKYAGWLDHIGCVWQVQSSNSEKDIKAEHTLVITKIGRESENRVFEGTFQFKVMFAQCFQISDNMNKNTSFSQTFRILVFTTDMVYQLHVTIVENVVEQPNQQKQIHIVRDDKAFAPICSNQVNFTCAKQHPSGMIIAAGSQNSRAQAVQLWLSAKIESLAYTPFSLNPMSFFSGTTSNKRSKKVQCPQDGIVSSLFNVLSGIQLDESVTDISFNSIGSQMSLLITDIKSPLLSKVNFYDIKKNISNSITQKLSSILTSQEEHTLTYSSTISLKLIFDKVRQILEFPQNIPSKVFQIMPVHIAYLGEVSRLYLSNGMIIEFCVQKDFNLQIINILLSPIDQAMQIQNQLNNQQYDKELLSHFLQKDNFQNLNPFFPSNCEYLDFKGDEQTLDIFKLGANIAQDSSKFEILKADSIFENDFIHEYLVVSRPNQGQHVFYVRRSTDLGHQVVTSQYSLPENFVVQSMQIISGTKVNILSVEGQCIKMETQTNNDILCQFLNLKERFENQNHQKTLNRTQIYQVETGNLQTLLKDLSMFLEFQFNDLRFKLTNRNKQSKISVIQRSKLYKFLEDLILVQKSTTTNRCMSTDAFYLKKQNLYVDFISNNDSEKVDKLVKVRVNQEIKNQAKILMLQIIEKYFENSMFEGSSQEELEQQQNESYEKVDHREAEHKDLQLSKYSVKGQVQYSLIMGFLTHILKPFLSMKVFNYEHKSKNLLLNKALVSAHKEIQSDLTTLQALSNDMLASQTFSLFRSLRLLISLLIQGWAFFQTSLVQNQSERLATLNQNIMVFDKYVAKRSNQSHNSQLLIFNNESALFRTEFERERLRLFTDIGNMTLSEYLIQGTQSARVMVIIETYITYDQSFIDDQIIKNYPLFLKPEITELILSRKYLERASQLLKEMNQPGDFARDNEYRQQILNQALNCLLKNTINTDLETSLKLLMENYLYIQSIVFCLNKAQDSMQTQKFLISQSAVPVLSQIALPTDDEDQSPAITNIDEKIQVLEVEKLNCFTFIVELLEVVILRLARQRKEIKEFEFHKQNICKPINLAALQQPESIFVSLFCKRTYQKRTKPGFEEDSQTFGPSGQTHASNFFSDLYPAFALPEQLQKVSQFTAIKVFQKQLKYLDIPDLVKLKDDVLDLISSKEEQKPRQEDEHKNFGLDLLHRGIFQLLMKNDLVDDLFRINSPYLQSFIENEMWMYTSGTVNKDISVGNIHNDAATTLQENCLKFQQILNFTSKHFMVLQQPLGLFQYLFEVLVQAPESGEHEKYKLSISDRITWLQKAIACIDDASLSKCRFSSEMGIKRERVINVVKLHQIQKLMVEKLNKKKRSPEQIDDEQESKAFMFLQEKFNYYPIFEIQELYDVANDFNMFGIQLRIISLLQETSLDQGPDATEARAIQSEYAWSGFIRNNYIQKCLIVRERKLEIDNAIVQAFKEKLKRFMRVLENVDRQFLVFEILELTQKHLKEQKANFDCFFQRELYWLTDLLISNDTQVSEGILVFETFNQILKNQLELHNHTEMQFEILEEPMKFIYPCIVVMKICELKNSNLTSMRLLSLEAERLAGYFQASFSGDMQLLYTKETIASYKQFELRLQQSIKKINKF